MKYWNNHFRPSSVPMNFEQSNRQFHLHFPNQQWQQIVLLIVFRIFFVDSWFILNEISIDSKSKSSLNGSVSSYFFFDCIKIRKTSGSFIFMIHKFRSVFSFWISCTITWNIRSTRISDYSVFFIEFPSLIMKSPFKAKLFLSQPTESWRDKLMKPNQMLQHRILLKEWRLQKKPNMSLNSADFESLEHIQGMLF